MSLPETFFNSKQAREKANHSCKKNKGKKEREKKNSKVEKPNAHAWAKMSKTRF